MACSKSLVLIASLALGASGLTTCPGFPGFCSESFPGQSCQVVCEAGRNNVPLCQDDGTWTDIPRCIEHEPGVEEQIPGLCPGVSGYCATGFLNGRCRFDCTTGRDIDSICTADGTWSPYPTCQGDRRDLRDGCDGCPGPFGGPRNRTAEAILNQNTVSDRRVPKTITGNGGRKNVPSFAGNINIGPLTNSEKKQNNRQQNNRQQNNRQQNNRQQNNRQQNNRQQNNRQQFSQNNNRQQQRFNQNNQNQQQFNQNQQQSNNQFNQNRQQNNNQFNGNRQQNNNRLNQNRQQQNSNRQQPRRNPLFAEQFPTSNSGNRGVEQQGPANTQTRFEEQPRRPQPQPQRRPDSNLSLFDQIKARAQGSNSQPSAPSAAVPRQRPTSPARRGPAARPGSGFGVFESVDLSGGPSAPAAPSRQPNSQRQSSRQRPSQSSEGRFGVFESVDLSG